ncbi:succinate dehydrogenase assembly factor 2 [Methyloferula stellata]|uniref:FAD assembly factor SdhE n=1 Tax=Methyloferula stellata TaxID=876270 RepID=UPI001FCAABEB|nr:succinate dehydrogenase assembly factor 2 [Methyloferula stellata]
MDQPLKTPSRADLDLRRRRILFRSWHRGMREMDLILGGFAEAKVADLSDAELDDFEILLDATDRDVFGWVTGEFETPANFDTGLFRKICAFHTHEKPLHS